MNYKSYLNLNYDILKGLNKIPTNIDLIVGIPRSGMIPAYIIGSHLNLAVITLSEFLDDNVKVYGKRPLNASSKKIKNILVVDDSIYTGVSIKLIKEELKAKELEYDITYLAVYASKQVHDEIDLYLEIVTAPRMFQWNYKNHIINSHACFDIDGVLCADPSEEDNDDGKKYLEFIKNAQPLFIPKFKISCLVTSRLEKYRQPTIDWLKKHDVDYDELIMLDFPNAHLRRNIGIHAQFKAEIYKKRDEIIFFESSWEQSKAIYEISKKPVLCVENDFLINTFEDIAIYDIIHNYCNNNTVVRSENNAYNKSEFLQQEKQALEETNLKLRQKLDKLSRNKWLQFSYLNKQEKIKFLILTLFSKKS